MLKEVKKFLLSRSEPAAKELTNKLNEYTAEVMRKAKEKVDDPSDLKAVHPHAMELILENVKHVRVGQTWNSEMHKIEICTVPHTSAYDAMRVIMQTMIMYAQAEKKESMAPKGKLERQIVEWLSKQK